MMDGITPGEVLPAKVRRDFQGLRDALFDEIDALREGRSTPVQALAVAALARQIIATGRIEMEAAVHARTIEHASRA